MVCRPGLAEDDAEARAHTVEQHLEDIRLLSAFTHLYRGASVGSSTRLSDESPLAFLERAVSAMRARKASCKSDES